MNEINPNALWPGQEPNEAPASYHIEATKSLVDRTLRTLKQDDLFGVFDKQGDCRGRRGRAGRPVPPGHPLPLRAQPPDRRDGAAAARLGRARRQWRDGGRPRQCRFPRCRRGRIWLQRDSIHASRVKFLCGDHLLRADQGAPLQPDRALDRARFRASMPISPICSKCAASAARGAARSESRGSTSAACASPMTASTALERCTTLHFDPAPDALSERHARWDMDLDAARAVQPGDQDRLRDRRARGGAAAHALRLSHGAAQDQRAGPRPRLGQRARTNCSTRSSTAPSPTSTCC